jgi:D-alanyl-D-alanine carboxypeptidase/D-alanyl-D-alanine-endopeptidase (penicillin-binding protein 4)
MIAKREASRVHLSVAFLSFSILLALLLGLAAQTASLAQDQGPVTVPATSSPSPSPPQPARNAVRISVGRSASTSSGTLAELQSRIEQIVRQPALAPGFFAVKIVSLDTGTVIFEQDANKFVRPASNMKLYTVAAAFDRLTPDFRFITSVYAKEKVEDGKVKGDLIIYGRGDPSIAARFNKDDYFKGINDLADRIAAAGVKRIKGDLVGDESYFNGEPLGSGWEWEDLQWSYGAAVSALTVNDNAVDLTVRPGERVGAPLVIATGPPASGFMTITNRGVTSARGSKSELEIHRGLGTNTLEISGSLPLGDDGFSSGVAIPDPALAFVSMLRDALAKRGVKVDGRVRTVSRRSGGSIVPDSSNAATAKLEAPVEIASLQSPPFSLIAAHTLKPSQNLYTELILRTLGKMTSTTPNQSNEAAGLEVVRNFLRQAGASENELALDDGSGLSRNDMIMADATVELLTFMSRHKYFAQFREALPVAGVDGTLRSRMRGTPAEGNVRAKTGTLSSVASLAGYVTTASGERLVFSMMLNNFPDASAVRRDSIDAIAILLASFAGKTQ